MLLFAGATQPDYRMAHKTMDADYRMVCFIYGTYHFFHELPVAPHPRQQGGGFVDAWR